MLEPVEVLKTGFKLYLLMTALCTGKHAVNIILSNGTCLRAWVLLHISCHDEKHRDHHRNNSEQQTLDEDYTSH